MILLVRILHQSQLPDKRIILIHSHFLQPDRAEKEKELLDLIGKSSTRETRDGLIVVGTQVLEQSLDVDFDYMVTDLCPMDLLLQRIGRLHRHKRERPETAKIPVCAVLGSGDDLNSGSAAIYGKWLLMKTRELLPQTILIPNDIPSLVHTTYQDPTDEELQDAPKREAWENQKRVVSGKSSRASGFLLGFPPKYSAELPETNTMAGMLENSLSSVMQKADASVRDGDNSISVILLVKHNDGSIGFVPWQNDGKYVSGPDVPREREAREIARQKINLPAAFCKGHAESIISALEKETRRVVPEWQFSGWLQNECILFLDENLAAEIGPFEVQYTCEQGLTYKKKEGKKS